MRERAALKLGSASTPTGVTAMRGPGRTGLGRVELELSLERELDDLLAPHAGEGRQVATGAGDAGEPLRRWVTPPPREGDLSSEFALGVVRLEVDDALVVQLLAVAAVEPGGARRTGPEGEVEGGENGDQSARHKDSRGAANRLT